MDQFEERAHLESVLAGTATPTLGPPATLGRLAQLYLETPESPGLAEKAFLLTQAAIQLVPPENPLRPKLLHFHAMAMRWKQDSAASDPGMRRSTAEMDREAWKLGYDKAPREAILLSREWADWAWDREFWEEASEAYSNAHRALRRVLLRQTIESEDRLDLLQNAKYAARGAYAFAKMGNPREAIILLERASDLLFSRDRQRWELLRLAQSDPDLHGRLDAAERVRVQMHQQHGLDSFGNLSAEEFTAQAEVDSIVNEVRKVDGFASFALPSNWKDVQEAVSKIPLVYMVPTDKGCACFVLKFAGGEITKTAFIDIRVTVAEIYNAAKAFIEAEFGDVRSDARPHLLALLKWLGLHIMIHVKKQLHDMRHDDLPFVIIPFGFLSNVPLHAACLPRDDPPRLWFLFHPRRVSYAYSARSIVESQRRSGEAPASPALVINNPRPLPPTFDPLMLSDFEAAVVASHFSATVLSGQQATTSKICEALPAARIAHFSCHGTVDRRIQYSGILILARGEVLSYEQLRWLPRLSARLVVLSACRTGSSAITVEHVVNLPAAFLAAGAVAVLGTFWHSDELASLLLLQRFYELWVSGICAPVEALGDAQEWLMTSSADLLRAALPQAVLASPAAERLREAPADEIVYVDPWYWSNFFLAGT
jgi:CHAT domain-containing protein